ncbi:methylamine utilization protein, partial [Rhodococcus sp. GG48]|nr:methylamine utilization protein [Rhodococcus sp. GG48]
MTETLTRESLAHAPIATDVPEIRPTLQKAVSMPARAALVAGAAVLGAGVGALVRPGGGLGPDSR